MVQKSEFSNHTRRQWFLC
uniref:Uncharacterized protein n=1 Tax=Anguilla anguilla TaxID=7936 RepID=A0A0E9P577_ANGAN